MQNISSFIDFHFGVHILQREATPRYRIVYSLTPPPEIDFVDGERLVYTRHFDQIEDALGHKLFLEQLSDESIERIIKRQVIDNCD